MGFVSKKCVELVCDGGCEGPWEEGAPHFESEAAAIEYARRNGWAVAGKTLLCEQCATKADCARTEHQWMDWEDRELQGVQHRARWCEHCGFTEFNPPFEELRRTLAVLRDLERIVTDAAGGESRG